MIDVSLKLTITQFISFLIFPIILPIFLHGIIGQMNDRIFKVRQIVQFRSCTDVPLLIPVKFMPSVDGQTYHVGSDIEFSVIVEQKIFDVGLDYEFFWCG